MEQQERGDDDGGGGDDGVQWMLCLLELELSLASMADVQSAKRVLPPKSSHHL
jgi:hypothetical protein